MTLLLLTGTGPAQAALTIEITQGVEGAMPVAVVPFGWQGAAGESPPVDVSAVIAADLARSGRFSTLPVSDMLSRPHLGSDVNFRDWRLLNVDNLVVGRIVPSGGSYIVQFQLYDVLRSQQLIGYSIRSTAAGLRLTAHQISDLIYETLLGEPGAFATRIAYVTETRGRDGKPRYSLQVADADGYNPQPVLNSTRPLLSPSWSPDGTRLAYVSFESNRPAIYIQQIDSGERRLLTSYPGLNGAPAWSPDGKKLALVLSKDGSADVYILDLVRRNLRRITRNYAIDTEPVWYPDGSALIFTSDRGGTPQLYRIRLTDGKTTRLTFEGRYNTRASFSPDGKRITFVHGDGGTFRIAIMELDTGAMQVLTDSRLDESPSFAPNGSMIIYATEDKGRGVLSAVSVDGRVKQRLALQEGDAREPAWSPYTGTH
jgi:TolB protein